MRLATKNTIQKETCSNSTIKDSTCDLPLKENYWVQARINHKLVNTLGNMTNITVKYNESKSSKYVKLLT